MTDLTPELMEFLSAVLPFVPENRVNVPYRLQDSVHVQMGMRYISDHLMAEISLYSQAKYQQVKHFLNQAYYSV